MNARERYASTLLFKPVDRVPLIPGHGRQSTRERWHSEGLPRDVPDVAEYAYRQAGGTLPWPKEGEQFHVNERMMPQFAQKVLEKRERSQVVQDWKGNICEIGLEFTLEHLVNAIDFCTRRWIKCPVETHADWESMKHRYDPDDPSRLPEDAAERGRRLRDRQHPVKVHLSGPFWQLREWLGFEPLCMLFIEDPAWIREMITFWGNYIARLLERTLEYVVPDHLHFSEDMAYKAHPMISPAMTREFLVPVYRQWGKLAREAGVPIYGVDSDGHVGDLLPVWIESGLNMCDPMEVAAGNDLPAYRKRYGKQLSFAGGVDKRAMAAGGRAIEDEIARLTPVIRGGGYIPSCDHGVPADVSWSNYVRHTQLLAEVTGWL